MKLTFLGAAREVTGSRFFLEANGKNIMVDYGMEQGTNIYENAALPISAGQLDYIFLTHAHIDHSGYLPLLVKNGFQGAIYATEATADLCQIMLLDSAHIQEMDAEWKNRKAQRSGKPLVEPLYTQEDASNTHRMIVPCAYRKTIQVTEGISVQFVDVGHLLGSASIELTVTEEGKTQKLVFSGDIGNINQPLLRNPEYCTDADYVIMESTYGDRTHGPVTNYVEEMTRILKETFDRGGNVVIPSFAVGRTQEMLYFLRKIKQDHLVPNHEDFPVFVDSPLAIEATNIFNENMTDYMDTETLQLLKQGINPISFDGLKVSVTAEESKLINEDTTPKVIISASGMCDAGRIRHHLKHNLWRPESTVLFVGYQSVGTLGRSLVDGAKNVKIFGESIEVKCNIQKLAGVSGHADMNGLLKWIDSFQTPIRHVFVVHGEDAVAEGFANHLREEKQLVASAPYNDECWDLTTCQMLREGNKEKLEKPSRDSTATDSAPSQGVPTPISRSEDAKKHKEPGSYIVYAELQAAGKKIERLIDAMDKAGRKEISKLTQQLSVIYKRFSKKK